jgi:hypothetical protein
MLQSHELNPMTGRLDRRGFETCIGMSRPSLSVPAGPPTTGSATSRRETVQGHMLLRFFTCLISMLLLALAQTIPIAEAQSQTEEYRVKAALLFHFAQLVDWPPSAFASDTSAITLCTLRQDPFDGELEATLEGKMVGPRPVHILHLKDLHDAAGCHLLFVSANENKRVPSVLTELGKAPIMTVGESDGFLEQGGMIRLDVEEGKIRFAINLDASEQAGLKISSRMLLLAKTVVGKHK